jgi:hypothetical protein
MANPAKVIQLLDLVGDAVGDTDGLQKHSQHQITFCAVI